MYICIYIEINVTGESFFFFFFFFFPFKLIQFSGKHCSCCDVSVVVWYLSLPGPTLFFQLSLAS